MRAFVFVVMVDLYSLLTPKSKQAVSLFCPSHVCSGTYNDQPWTANLTQPCTTCPLYTTTSIAGADDVSMCNRELPAQAGLLWGGLM